MILFYIANGDIVQASYNADEFSTVGISENLQSIEIDELTANKVLCSRIVNSLGRVNSSGRTQFYVDTNELYEVDNWQPEEF